MRDRGHGDDDIGSEGEESEPEVAAHAGGVVQSITDLIGVVGVRLQLGSQVQYQSPREK